MLFQPELMVAIIRHECLYKVPEPAGMVVVNQMRGFVNNNVTQ